MLNLNSLCLLAALAAGGLSACRDQKGSATDGPAGVDVASADGGAAGQDVSAASAEASIMDRGGDIKWAVDAADVAVAGDVLPAAGAGDTGGVPCGGSTCQATQICLTFGGGGGPMPCAPPGDGGNCPEGSEYTASCRDRPGAGCLPAPPPPRCADHPAGCPADQPACACAPKDVCLYQSYVCSTVSGRTVSCFSKAQ